VETRTETNHRNLTLLRHRLDAGLSQRQIAEAIGVSTRVYQYAEQGGTPQPRHAVKFADYYGLPVTELFYPDLEIAA
jgi:transcriptional regulator with XRE-family HTH domain